MKHIIKRYEGIGWNLRSSRPSSPTYLLMTSTPCFGSSFLWQIIAPSWRSAPLLMATAHTLLPEFLARFICRFFLVRLSSRMVILCWFAWRNLKKADPNIWRPFVSYLHLFTSVLEMKMLTSWFGNRFLSSSFYLYRFINFFY